MAKFVAGSLDHAGFLAIKEPLTIALAAAIEAQLEVMGEDVKGITWFSSCAEDYARASMPLAA